MQQQGLSPERQDNELQRKNSMGKRWKELVIDCISPNTKQVRLSFRGPGSPSPDRPAARQLFVDKGFDAESPAAEPCSQPDSSRKPAFVNSNRYDCYTESSLSKPRANPAKEVATSHSEYEILGIKQILALQLIPSFSSAGLSSQFRAEDLMNRG